MLYNIYGYNASNERKLSIEDVEIEEDDSMYVLEHVLQNAFSLRIESEVVYDRKDSD